MTNQKIALITGASRGIGRALAEKLIDDGVHVIALARTQRALEELDDYAQGKSASCTLVPCDLLKTRDFKPLADQIAARFGKLNALYLNAAMLGELTPLRDYPQKLWHEVMTVNCHAHAYLLAALDPLLRAAPAATVHFTLDNTNTGAYWGAYAVSKAALATLADIYEAENATTTVRVERLIPPPTATVLRRQAFPGRH